MSAPLPEFNIRSGPGEPILPRLVPNLDLCHDGSEPSLMRPQESPGQGRTEDREGGLEVNRL